MKHLFVHIPKNGGMSIRRGIPDQVITASAGNLVSTQYEGAVRARMAKDGEHHGLEHARWRDWSAELRLKHPAVAIVRNPWDRTVSRYLFAKYHGQLAGARTFPEFLDQRFKYGQRDFYWHRAIKGWYQQLEYVTNELGVLKCDILRFGTDDYIEYFGLDGPLPVRNRTNIDRVPYQDFYTDETLQAVGQWYQDDIEFFGFDFNSDATENIWGAQ